MKQTDQIFWEVNECWRKEKVNKIIEIFLTIRMEVLRREIRKLVKKLNHSLPFKKRIEIINLIYAKQSDIYKLRNKLIMYKVQNFIKKVMEAIG